MEQITVQQPLVVRLAKWSTLFALVVLILGAYTRLSDAGLGCPDWPGCYGQLDVPQTVEEIAAAEALYPQSPVEQEKAWKEMVHRYFAGTLGLLILAITILSWRRRHVADQLLLLPTLLLLLVTFQALLGMWTVTLLVQPAVVTAHLLGGVSTTALLWWFTLRQGYSGFEPVAVTGLQSIRWMAWGGVLLIGVQIALGGWTSTHYAALACIDFPGCYPGNNWPQTDFDAAFTLFAPLGVNYEGGVLNADARATIHMVHRIGALVVMLWIGTLAIRLLCQSASLLRIAGGGLLAVLVLQLALGISNVLLSLPLAVAVAHNIGATLLLLTLLTVCHRLTPSSDRWTGKEDQTELLH